MVANILMLAGAVAWLGGELWGAFTGRSTKRDTTSAWIWALETKYPALRLVIGVFVLSLFGHLMFGWWLLP